MVTASVLVGDDGVNAVPLTLAGAPTVRTKLELEVKTPSVTLSVIVEVPFWPLDGVTVTVRAVPLPPITMFAFGTSVVFDDAPVTDKIAVFSSPSPTVN